MCFLDRGIATRKCVFVLKQRSISPIIAVIIVIIATLVINTITNITIDLFIAINTITFVTIEARPIRPILINHSM